MAAPVFDVAATAPGSAGATSYNWSHTVGSGANRILIIGEMYVGGAVDNQINAITSSVNGAFTRIPSWSITDALGLHMWGGGWYIINPTAGAHTLTVDFGSNTPGDAAGGSISYTGVNQTTPFGTLVTATSSTSSVSANVSSATDELIFSSVGFIGAGGGATVPGTGVTMEFDGIPSNSDSSKRCAGGEIAGASSVTVSWSNSGAFFDWVLGAIALNPVGVKPIGPFVTFRPDLP